MPDAKKLYEVTVDRFIEGRHRSVGDPIRMTELAAKYYMEPYGSGLKPAKPAKKQAERLLEKPTA